MSYITPKAGETIKYGHNKSKSEKLRERCNENWTWELVCLTHSEGFVGKDVADIQGHVHFYKGHNHKIVVHCSGHGWEAVPVVGRLLNS